LTVFAVASHYLVTVIFAWKLTNILAKCIAPIAAVGVGIWDTKFGVYHSWTPLSDSKQSHGQVCRGLDTDLDYHG